eukprot:gene69147-94771_t
MPRPAPGLCPCADAAHDQVTATQDAEGFSESYTLNAFGERITVRNKLGNDTSYTFDKRGLVLTETLPITTKNSGGTTIAVVNSYGYDLAGSDLPAGDGDFGSAHLLPTSITDTLLCSPSRTSGQTASSLAIRNQFRVLPNRSQSTRARGCLFKAHSLKSRSFVTSMAWRSRAAAQI